MTEHNNQPENDLNSENTDRAEDVQPETTPADPSVVVINTASLEPESAPSANTTEDKSNDVIVLPRAVFNYIMVAIVFFVVGALMGSFVFPSNAGGNQPTEVTATLPDDFEATVRSAVISVFQDAGIDVAAGPRPGERYEVVMNPEDPFLGNPDAPITIIEFSDFLCGFCGRFANDTLPTLMEEYGDQVRFVYMDFPVINPQASPVIASAAECADDQGLFWEYHDVLFANSGSINNTDVLYTFAEEVGVEMETFRTCFEEGIHFDEIEEDEAYARELGIRGTPAFFINGRFVNGAQPIEVFREILDEELANLDS